jgi:hypothetical protein
VSISSDLQNFAQGFQQQVIARAELAEEGSFHETAFTELMIEYLADAGELEDGQVCLHRATGVQLSGYAISENGESLDLLIAIHRNAVPPETILKADCLTAFKRVMAFFTKASKGYHDEIEESGPAFDIAQQVYQARRENLTQVRFILITDGIVKNPPPQDQDLPGIRANFEIWDLERLYRFVSSGRQREAIEIDFEHSLGQPIPCLAQPNSSAEYAAYLAIFPAQAIVDVYGKYGSRLLERNVRSFLQARGKVNAGMRETIRTEPHRFLAFNNGLSATAEAVTVVDLPGGGVGLKAVRDLQIVNGGQTTASIYHAVKKDKADVSQLFVQVKLTVLNDPAQMDVVVPLISRYANSQNKIQEADLAANDAYHRKLEELSRTVWAPAKDGTQRQTKWFYERARAQYQDERARAGTPAKLREFEAMYPKSQLFTKTDLAKAIVTWHMRPDIVSKGAQACFVWFMSHLDDIQKLDGDLDVHGYERLTAKLILFRSADRLIKQKSMPFTGYWANLVTYAVGRLVHETNGWIDLGRIWREQRVSPALERAIVELAQHAWSHINEPIGGANVTQYCKQQRCWTAFLDRAVYVSQGVHDECLRPGTDGQTKRRATAATVAGQESIQRIRSVGSQEWFAIHLWAKEKKLLTNYQLSLVLDLASAAGTEASITAQRAAEGVKILEMIEASGFSHVVVSRG